ncbi:MAG: DNA repair protein [Aeromonadaceae bacterium]
MILTLVLLSIGALLFLVIAYNIVQQYKQKQESDRRYTMSKQKLIIDESDELLLNANRLPYTKTLVLLLQNRILDALKAILEVNPNLSSVRQRIQDVTAQIAYVQEHYSSNEESAFRTPDSDRQALQMLQLVKKIRAVVRIEHNKGKIDPQAFGSEDRRLELLLLKINVSNLIQRAMDAQIQRQFGSAKQMLTKGVTTLAAIHDKDAWLITREEEMRMRLREMAEAQEQANQKELDEMKEKKDDLDVLFQPKRKW